VYKIILAAIPRLKAVIARVSAAIRTQIVEVTGESAEIKHINLHMPLAMIWTGLRSPKALLPRAGSSWHRTLCLQNLDRARLATHLSRKV